MTRDEDLDLILAALIDAQPGPLYECDPMCRSLFADKGDCNCSVARNLAAREAVGRLRNLVAAARLEDPDWTQG